MKDLIVLVVKWLFRRKRLYRITGIACVTYIFIELNTANIPMEAEPNYTKIGEEYGEAVKTFSGWLVDKFGGGVDLIGVAIAGFILLVCLLIEFNILKPQKIINAKNIFSGWFQKNTINNYNGDE